MSSFGNVAGRSQYASGALAAQLLVAKLAEGSESGVRSLALLISHECLRDFRYVDIARRETHIGVSMCRVLHRAQFVLASRRLICSRKAEYSRFCGASLADDGLFASLVKCVLKQQEFCQFKTPLGPSGLQIDGFLVIAFCQIELTP